MLPPVAGESIKSFVQSKIDAAILEINKAIARGRLDIIDESQYDYLIPNTYAILEAARSGENVHNLGILSQYMIDRLADPEQAPFSVRSASRMLESFSKDDIRMLAVCYKSFRFSKIDKGNLNHQEEYGHLYEWTEASFMYQELNNSGSVAIGYDSIAKMNSYLAFFASRGFLYLDGLPWLVGGLEYFKTSRFDALMVSALKTEEFR